jgi:endonuclease-3
LISQFESAMSGLVTQTLDRLYPVQPIPLEHRDPYTLLVAVLLSAQCTDARVNQVTPALFARAHTPESMSKLPVEEIREIIRPCGLAPTKAKNISALSRILSDERGGEVPRTLEELEALPGVGHKTASVVISQAFGIPAFPVDTHIHRLLTRWRLTSGKKRSADRTGCQTDLSRAAVECPAPSDYLLRQRALPRQGPR